MLIGELARETGLTPDTIRFYEKKKLLDRNHRTRRGNNYKDYGPAALERLRLVSQAKCAGFTLSEIEQCLQKWDTLSLAERKEIILDKMRQIDRRMAEMEQMKAYLKTLMPSCLADCGR